MKRVFGVMAVALLAAQVGAIPNADRLIGGFGPSWLGGPAERGEKLAARADPADLFTNIGSRIDGAGMCVDTSIETQARFLGMDYWRGYRDYFAQREPGGNYPDGVVRQVTAYAKSKGIAEPKYAQYEGSDPTPFLELAEKTGRGCCIAYGFSPRYGGQAINHMVFCPHPRGNQYAAIADNNLIGGITADEAKRYEWMSREELIARMKTAADRWGRPVPTDAWAFCWLEPPPPPSPFN